MRPFVTSIDILVHPWWSAIFDEAPYFDYQTKQHFPEYLRPLQQDVTIGDYLSFLGHLWQQRIQDISEDAGQLFVLQWAHALPDYSPEEEALLRCAQERMGERFVLWDNTQEDRDFYLRLWEHLPLRQRLFRGRIAINAYGEKCGDCVPRLGAQVAYFFQDNGFSPELEIIPEFCGDVIDGKVDAYRKYLEKA